MMDCCCDRIYGPIIDYGVPELLAWIDIFENRLDLYQSTQWIMISQTLELLDTLECPTLCWIQPPCRPEALAGNR